MKNLIRRFVIWWRMTGWHRWQNVGSKAVWIARELGEKYQPEEPKPKQTLPGQIPEPQPPPFSGECFLYEDDHLRIDVRIDFNLVMFVSLPSISVEALVGGAWQDVFYCYSQGCSRYNYGEWVSDLCEIAHELQSKAHRAKKAKHKPIEPTKKQYDIGVDFADGMAKDHTTTMLIERGSSE